MTRRSERHRGGAIAVVALALVPLTALVAMLGPAAIAVGLQGISRGDLGRFTPLLLWAVGLPGLIGLWSGALPVALGKRRDVAVGAWRGAAMAGGVAVSLALLLMAGQGPGPPEKAYINWCIGYGAVSGLAGAAWVVAHRVRAERT